MYEGNRKLASIRRISALTPIEGADRIEVAHVGGWKIVVGKGEFNEGDLVVYFEIDSFLPIEPRYEFLRSRCLRTFKRGNDIVAEGFRIKTCKLRGVISQGLVMPLSQFPEIEASADGDDVTKVLKIDHYDDVSAPFMPVSIPCGDKMSDFPSFAPKTDEERIQNLEDVVFEYANKLFEVTVKRDGSSLTAFYSPTYSPEDPFGVCTRNMRLKRPSEDTVDSRYWDVILKNGIDAKITDYCKSHGRELAFQGELVGPGVNGNRSLFKTLEWHVFRIWDIASQEFVECSDRRKICEEIGVGHVPVVDEAMPVFQKFKTVDEVLAFADGVDDRGNMREGLVFKETGTTRPVSFKAVSNKYLLKCS